MTDQKKKQTVDPGVLPQELSREEKEKRAKRDQINRSTNMSMGLDEGMPKDLELKDDV